MVPLTASIWRQRLYSIGPAWVIVGSYGGVQSPVRAPQGIKYLLVTIPAGESWTYAPPIGHRSLWISVSRGFIYVPSRVDAEEIAIFEPGSKAVTFETRNKTAVFVLGSATPHPYELKFGYYSVHTSDNALKSGEAKNIRNCISVPSAGNGAGSIS